MGEALHRSDHLIQIHVVWRECWTCGVPFGIPTFLNHSRLEDGRAFWCPNGHANHLFKTNPDTKPTVAERQELVAALHRAEAAAEDATARLAAKGRPKGRASAAKGGDA
jgi:hypothetical protein